MKLKRKFEILFLIFGLIVGVFSIVQSPFLLPFAIGGVILNGILGGFSGKVGPVVGAAWKGIQYMRAYVVPANPNTTGQQTQRSKFTKMSKYASAALSTIIQTYWDPFAEAMSGFNRFVQYNIGLLSGTNDMTINNKVTLGSLEGAAIDSASLTVATGVCEVTWTNSPVGNGLSTDVAVIVAFENGLEIWRTGAPNLTRADESGSVTISPDTDETSVVIYLFFHRGTGEEFIVSNSEAKVPDAV